jgi:hypothetical protein
MKKFVNKTIKPLLIIGGLGTALAGLNAFFPRFAVENVQNLEFVQEYTIFVQHWGIMVCLMGVMMVLAAFKESWRLPIMIYSALEKAFMVYLIVVNGSHPYSEGFYIPATMDAIIVIYSVLYFLSLRED